MRTNLLSWLKAAGWFIRTPKKQLEHAKEVGAFTSTLLNEMREHGAGFLFRDFARPEPQSTMKRITGAILKPFEVVEHMNRAIDTRAGEFYFDQVTRALQANPEDRIARLRLKNLGFDPAKVQAAGPEELTALRYLAGKRISDQTQFKTDVQSKGLFAQSPVGQMVYQFKTFAINQMKFMLDELSGSHGDHARTVRAWALMFTAMPAAGAGWTAVKAAIVD